MKKIVLVFGLITMFLSNLYSQEICDNGIDDDGDGLIDLNDTIDCNCDPASIYLPNPSFEKMTSSCNITAGNMNCCESWDAGNISPCSPDYCNLGGFAYNPAQNWTSVRFQKPAPDGTGVVIIIAEWGPGNYEYISACLLTPLLAGVPYTFEFSTHCLNEITANTEMALYGSNSCPVMLNSPAYGCLDDLTNPNWTKLGSVSYPYPRNSWITKSFTFTPAQDIYSVQIGVACNGTPAGNAFHLDNLKLYENKPKITSLIETKITCTESILKATADSIGGNFQWYLNGVALSGETKDSLETSSPGLYTVSYDLGGSKCASDTITVQVSSNDTAAFSYSLASYCLTDTDPTALISATTGGNFTISNAGIIDTASGKIDISGSGAGSFTVTYTTKGACPDTATFNIDIVTCNPPTALYTMSDSIICTNECITIIDNSIGATNWQWTFNGGTPNIASTSGPHNICFNTPGTYTMQLIASNQNGADTISSNIEILPKDDASFSYAFTTICDSLSSVLPTGIITPGGTFSINNSGIINVSSGEINATTMSIGTYIVTHTTTGVCPDTATFGITIAACTPPIANYSISDSAICDGECIDFTDLSVGATTWEWVFNGGTPSTANTSGPHKVCFNGPGTYSAELTVRNSFGTDTKSSAIEVYPTPAINAGNDKTIQLGESTSLNATGSNGGYSWTPPTWLDCPTCISPLATPEQTVTYTISVVDSNGCVSSDNVTIIVDYDIVIFVPNIFSPNGDGNNDVLFVRGVGVASLNFVVYDRWGEQVFQTQSLDNGWDGTFNGKPMNNAVFMYHLEANFIDGTTAEQKGDITLTR